MPGFASGRERDSLRTASCAFDPDHIVLALRGPEHADWQEKGLIDRIQSEVGIPMTPRTG